MEIEDIWEFLRTLRYYDKVDWSQIDMEELLNWVREEMPLEFTRELFLERLAFRSGSLINRSIEYDRLAALILIGLHEETTSASFMTTMRALQSNRDVLGQSKPIIEEEFMEFLEAHRIIVEEIYNNDAGTCFLPLLFGWKTLLRSYLLRSNGHIRERMQHMMLRVALFIHRDDWDRVIMCFRDLLAGRYTHATPTLFHAGTRRSQMASCFLPDAEVWTTRGVSRIVDVKIGDEVLTHTGAVRRVLQTHANPRDGRRLYRLETVRGVVADATGDHEFMVYDSWTKQHGWKRLDALRYGDYLMEAHRTNTNVADTPHLVRSYHPRIMGVILARIVSSSSDPLLATDIELPHVGTMRQRMYERLVRESGLYTQANMIIHEDAGRLRDFLTVEGRQSIIAEIIREGWVEEVATGFYDILREGPMKILDPQEASSLFLLLRLWTEDISLTSSPPSSSEILSLCSLSDACDGGCVKPPAVLMLNGKRFLRFRRRTRLHEAERACATVYTLGVEEDHSYAVGGAVAKNCFLMGSEDSVSGIFKSIADCGQISKWAGGIGIHISDIRANGSYIHGTNGQSNGIMPMLKVYNDVSCYIDQCFAPDVRIMTEDRGLIPISTIRAGDRVRNALGGYGRVAKILRYDWDGKMLSLWGCRVTPEHNFLMANGEYLSLGEASPEDHLVFPRSREFSIDLIEKILSVAGDTQAMDHLTVRQLLIESQCMSLTQRAHLLTLFREHGLLTDPDCVIPPWFPEHVRLGDIPIKEIHYKGLIYDLEMEKGGDPSYVTEIGAVHNGGGKRNGAFAMYLEPWHADILAFVLAKRNVGAEKERARDLFYGLWIPDLFMERVEKDEIWSLFCPASAPGLADSIGPHFRILYEEYERAGRQVRQIRARELWAEILRSQIETGTPYMLYKDACNYRSNQQNLGTIKSSNLCVAGETRLLTRKGIQAIAKLRDQEIEIWNGMEFASVAIRRTGVQQKLIRLEFSNGMGLTCTPAHNFYLAANEKEKVPAYKLEVGMRLAPFSLPPPISLQEDLLPPAIRLALDWVMEKAIHCDLFLRLYSHDLESLRELLLSLQWCGIESTIVLHEDHPQAYELRIPREKWRRLHEIRTDQQQQQEKIEGIRVVAIDDSTNRQGDTYCFTEHRRGRGMFEGICAGQCTEIIEYSDSKEYACCNLASIALPRFLRPNPRRKMLMEKRLVVYSKMDCPFCRLLDLEMEGLVVEKRDVADPMVAEEWNQLRKMHAITTVPAVFLDQHYVGGFLETWKSYLRPIFDFRELQRVVYAVVENLNLIIDRNVYPLPETEVSNKKHRPIGVGVQGLADVFGGLRLAFDEGEARALNREIFETIYYAALRASHDLAVKDGPYSSFHGSPLSRGIFHFELMAPVMEHHDDKKKKQQQPPIPLSDRLDWEGLRYKILTRGGVRNSLLIAPMPTASTSQILGNTECFEPWTSNVFLRRTNAGEFYVCNELLRRDLEALGMWDDTTTDRLILSQGSVAQFSIPVFLKNIYRTVWEISQKSLIDMAADRQYFIDQSQSLNIFVPEPSPDLLTKIHFYGWRKGLKTGCYYIRSRPPLSSINYGIDSSIQQSSSRKDATNSEEDATCLACSS